MSEFMKYRAADGHRWRFRANNYKIIADSGEAYINAKDRDDAILLAKQPSLLTFEFYKSGLQFYWRARARNNRVIADGSEGYWNESDCRSGAATFQREAPSASVIEQAA